MPVLVLRWLVRLLLSWEVFMVASATCASGGIFSGDFAKSRPRYLQSTASATPRRYFASPRPTFLRSVSGGKVIGLLLRAGMRVHGERLVGGSRNRGAVGTAPCGRRARGTCRVVSAVLVGASVGAVVGSPGQHFRFPPFFRPGLKPGLLALPVEHPGISRTLAPETTHNSRGTSSLAH